MTSEPTTKTKHKSIKYIELQGSNLFRLKIAYSFLLNRPIKMSNIRADSTNPGMTPYEVNFLRLVSEISNGTIIKINQTGTGFTLIPGTITNNYGDELVFECDKSRCITYYAEGLIPICLYGKESLHIKLKGITNNLIDNSVDSFKMSTCVLLQKLIVGDTVEFKINRRGVLPNGVGEVQFKIPIITGLAPFDWLNEGKIKRVRGVAFTSKLPASFTTQMIDTCRGVLNNFLPDVWIAVDNFKDKDLDKISPGYGISITAETKEGFSLSTDLMVDNEDLTKNANDISRECCMKFLNDLYKSGCTNTHNQGLFLFLMALSEKNYVSYMKIGKISEHTKQILKLIYKLFGVKFNIRECDEYDKEESEEDIEEENEDEEKEEEEDESDNNNLKEKFNKDELPIPFKQFMFSCVGIGLKNVARIEL
jgi:RNA 3'-terminal phosphate cyclase-like protein